MSILEAGFYLLINACRVYILYRFSRLFFERSRWKKWLVPSYAVFYVVNSLCYLFLNNDTVNMVINVVGLLLIILCGYGGSLEKKLLIIVGSYGINLLPENIAWVLFVKGRSDQMVEFGFWFSVFISFLLEIIIEKAFRFHKEADIPFYKDILLILISGGSLFISVTMIEGAYHNKGLLVISLCILLIINVAALYLYEKILEDYSRQKDEQMYKQQLVMYQNQLKIMQSANDTYKTIRHDMKHHMFMVANYIAKNEKDKALQYLEKINHFIENGEGYIKTGNECIDGIFNYIVDEVNKIGGRIKTDIKVATGMPIDDFDINVILSNLLFNAYEAVSKCDKKLIQAFMRYDRGVLIVKISNTHNGAIKKRGEMFLSTKTKSNEHGIGLVNVKKTVEKYNGEMKIDFTDEEYAVELLIYM